MTDFSPCLNRHLSDWIFDEEYGGLKQNHKRIWWQHNGLHFNFEPDQELKDALDGERCVRHVDSSHSPNLIIDDNTRYVFDRPLIELNGDFVVVLEPQLLTRLSKDGVALTINENTYQFTSLHQPQHNRVHIYPSRKRINSSDKTLEVVHDDIDPSDTKPQRVSFVELY